MNSIVSSLKSLDRSETVTQATVDYLKKMGRLKLWSGVVGIKSLQRADNDSALNREAESAHVRRTVWGAKGGSVDDMHDTYLGDVTHVHETKGVGGGGAGAMAKGLLGAGLIASGVGAPIGAWMLADALKSPTPVQQAPAATPAVIDTDTDTNTQYQLRLGKHDE